MMPAILKESTLLPVYATPTPVVSIVLPFDAKITPRKELEQQLQQILTRVSIEMEARYSREGAYPVLAGLRKLMAGLNYSTYKKSIAIFVSPAVSKVYYMNIHVNAQIAIDKPFDLRQLVESKQTAGQYMVCVLSSRSMKMFLGNTNGFNRILSSAHNIDVFENDPPERVANFSDPSAHKEVMLDKFMRYADYVLGNLLKCYPHPLFVLAPERTAGHFKKFTANGRHIVGYIHGNFEDATEGALRETVMPYIDKWEDVRQLHLLNRLDDALGAGKLAVGMRAVYREACGKKGQLLVVERNCTSPLKAFPKEASADQPFYIKDSVDLVIEKVLESGGDVEFVDEGALMQYRKIALIKYY